MCAHTAASEKKLSRHADNLLCHQLSKIQTKSAEAHELGTVMVELTVQASRLCMAFSILHCCRLLF